MKEAIINYLEKFEEEHGVKVLYAAESGSRAWGFASADSDYDVRFIYIHPPGWYLSIDKKRDVIEKMDGDLDFAGWDLRKALNLFRKNNPPMLEWLNSPIVYLDRFGLADDLRSLAHENFNPKTCIFHYLNIAKGNYREYLKGDLVKLKKYFYVLRPVLACIWIKEKYIFPPVVFQDLLDNTIIEDKLRSSILDLLKRKKDGTELDFGPCIPVLNSFLDKQIGFFGDYVDRLDKKDVKPFDFFNKLFQEKLKQVFGSTFG